MGFPQLSWPIVPFNILGTSSILSLPSYVLNYFQKAIIVFTTSDEMVNLLCSYIETIEIINKQTCQVFSLTPLFQLPTGLNFPSPQVRRTRERFSQQSFLFINEKYTKV
ncbi:hypothetical protein R3W88_016382 [Solanum pinnatisectum]|uniref:Uncharacterized protein n=1 Tax=Solanum pinnatisectum TaxID=50273 RepID=A0AAV9KXF0_9SOLN|nr:hypothetical protein R3W88_016382 [Solanum pinnatisectum]